MTTTIRSAALTLLFLSGLLVSTGCGVGVVLTSTAGPVAGGASVPFTITLNNPSVCPVGEAQVGIFPFVPLEQTLIVGDDEIEAILSVLLDVACTGEPVELPEGITCAIVDEQLVCEMETLRTGPPTQGDATVSGPEGPLLTCHREGSTVTCQRTAQALAAASSFVTTPLNCVPLAPGIIVCDSTLIDPGDSVSASFSLFAPASPGIYRTIAFAGAGQRDICKTGSRAGLPCDEDSECTGGGPDSCGDGICVDNTTQATGVGCDVTADCGGNETCVECNPGGLPLLIPLACAQIVVAQGAPAVSSWGLLASALGLLGLGFLGLTRMRRGWSA